MNLDENIAKIILERRKEQEREGVEKGKEKGQEGPVHLLGDMIEQIASGEMVLPERTYQFEPISLLGGRIRIPMVKNFLKEMTKEQDAFVFMSESRGISFTGSFISESVIDQSFQQFKEGMEVQFKQMGLYLEWLGEGRIKNKGTEILYGWFMAPTGNGDTYNLIFYNRQDGGTVIGNYNCFEKDAPVWKPMIEACLHLMDCAKE